MLFYHTRFVIQRQKQRAKGNHNNEEEENTEEENTEEEENDA